MSTLFPTNRERIYEEERIRFEAQEELRKQQGKKMAIFMSSGCLLLFVTIVGFFLITYYIGKSEEIPVGSDVKLYSSGGTVGVSVDLDAFNEYRHAIGAENKHTITRLILEGRIIIVDSGTKVRTISDGPTLYKVQVLEGRFKGQTGYLEDTYIIYAKASNKK